MILSIYKLDFFYQFLNCNVYTCWKQIYSKNYLFWFLHQNSKCSPESPNDAFNIDFFPSSESFSSVTTGFISSNEVSTESVTLAKAVMNKKYSTLIIASKAS